MRRLLTGLGIAGLLTTALPAETATAAPRMVTLAFVSQLQNPQQVGADAMRDKLLATSAERFVIDQRVGNALGGESFIVSAARSGSVDIAVTSGGVVSGVVPEMSVFDIPFLFRDEAHAKAVMTGPVASKMEAAFAAKGLVLLAFGKQGFRNITNSKQPIRTPADLKGMKIRVVPNDMYMMTFKALGADASPLDYPLLYGALKDGRLDGQENPLSSIAGSRMYEVQKYLTMSGHFFAPIAFVANREMFEQLDQADQEALMAAAKAGAEATWQMQLDGEKLAQLKGAGMQVVEQIDRQPFMDAVKPLEPEFEKRFGKDVIAAIRSTR
jgi:tripartite ATP-independent transporter DctP family solute receptor